MERVLFGPGGATEAKQDAIITALGQPVALDTATLAALEQVQVAIQAGQVVGLDSATLTALEQITVSGTVALDAPTLAALESITAVVSGTVALDGPTLAALESITATVSGAVSVSNFPSEYPLPAAQVTALTPVREVEVSNLPLDVFSNLVTGQRDNQIEVHFDDLNFATYLTSTFNSGGSVTQHVGHAHYETGTNTNGKAKAVTLDVIKYRPMHEIYAGFSAAWWTAGVANSWQRIGLFNDTDGIFIGYEGTAFGITHRFAGTDTFIPRATWDDPLTGGATSRFTRNGVPEALDVSLTNVFRIRIGWLGSFGFIMEVLSPDQAWVPFYTYKRPNTSKEAFLSNTDLPMAVDVGKTSAGATGLTVSTACWAGGTTSAKARLSDTITDRSLAETVRSVIEGQTPSGTYAKVKVNSQGRLQVTNDAVGANGAAAPTSSTLVGGVSAGNLVPVKVLADGTLAVPALSLATDNVRQTLRVSTPLSTSVTGPVTDQVLVSVPAGSRFRLIRNAGHVDPALALETYPIVTLKIGATTIYRDKLEAGLPWSETVCFEGADGDDLTISVDIPATIYLNCRYEVFPA